MRRLLFALLPVLMAGLFVAPPAEAAVNIRWRVNTYICVQDYTSDSAVSSAVSHLNDMPDLRVIKRSSCANYGQRVYVKAWYLGRAGHWYKRLAETRLRYFSDTGYIVTPVTIVRNRSYGLTWQQRETLYLHELLHAVGLTGHSSYCDTVLSTNGQCMWQWKSYTWRDKWWRRPMRIDRRGALCPRSRRPVR